MIFRSVGVIAWYNRFMPRLKNSCDVQACGASSYSGAPGRDAGRQSVTVDGNGVRRYMQWICAPGNKCVPVAEESFTDNINWRIFRIMAEFIEDSVPVQA